MKVSQFNQSLLSSFHLFVVLFDEVGEDLRVEGVLVNLDHTYLVALFDNSTADVGCDCGDDRRRSFIHASLFLLSPISHLSVVIGLLVRQDLLSCLKAVDLRHVEVH